MEKITLTHPVTWNGTKINHLSMRRPKVRDMIAADKAKGSDGIKEATMFANLCEVELEIIEELDLADYKKLQMAYTDFLSSPPKTQDAPALELPKPRAGD